MAASQAARPLSPETTRRFNVVPVNELTTTQLREAIKSFRDLGTGNLTVPQQQRLSSLQAELATRPAPAAATGVQLAGAPVGSSLTEPAAAATARGADLHQAEAADFRGGATAAASA